MLETVYREGVSKGAAPPEKMEVKGWLFLGLGSALALLALQPRRGWIGNAFGVLAILAAVVGGLATVYNIRRLPVIHDRWRKSAMCTMCGHVVVALS